MTTETTVKERPILFNAEMVRAVRAGRKTQTRRVIKGAEDVDCWTELERYPPVFRGCWSNDDETAHASMDLECPYGCAGDRLWVRETWADVNSEMGPSIAYRADGDIRGWEEFSETFGEDYGAGPSMDYESYPGDYVMWWSDLLNGEPDHKWKPSIHMFRWASRINLRIKDIRVERIQDISNADAIAEGIGEFQIGKTDSRAVFGKWSSGRCPGSWYGPNRLSGYSSQFP